MTAMSSLGRGAQTDYVLGTPFGWDAFQVVRWHATEGISRLFEYEVVLARDAAQGSLCVHDLVERGATFRIASAARWRPVHAMVAEAELVETTTTLDLYRLVLVPPWWRACHRMRCRSFVDRSLVEIVSAVLENRTARDPAGLHGLSPVGRDVPAPAPEQPSFASFEEPGGRYRWALVDGARAQARRAHVVQYNESDFDFVSRLLEAEGISYLFEHTASDCLLTLTDCPGQDSPFAEEQRLELVGAGQAGQADRQELVRTWRPARRLRSAAVTMRDYAWRKSTTVLQATACAAPGDADDLEHFEFPAADEDTPNEPAAAPARLQLERYRVEQALSHGMSTARCHEPGRRFRLVDRARLRDDQELVVVAAETYAVQLVPEGTALELEPFGFSPQAVRRGAYLECRFQTIPAAIPYRPPRATPKPRIDGVQPARVTAEELPQAPGAPGTELNSDPFGRVRVRFPWDQRPEDGTPSSKWVRVCQPWAGPGFGAMYVPRVGHEVLVAFERGDPDRPIVVGRLYNAQNPPPYAEANTTKSTVKSDSVRADGASAEGFNELRFDDRAQEEQIFLHAQRNLDEVVRACHTTSVGGDQSNSVGGNQSNTVVGTRTHTVKGGHETVNISADRNTSVGGSEVHQVTAGRETSIGALDELTAGSRATHVGTTDRLDVGAERTVSVKGDHVVDTLASYHSHACANHTFKSTNMYVTQAGAFQVNASTLWLNVGGAHLRMGAGIISLDNGAGAQVNLMGDMVMVSCGKVISLAGQHNLVSTGNAKVMAGGTVDVSGAEIKLND